MSVITDAKDSRLRLIFQLEDDEDGKPVFKTKTFSNIKSEAEDQAVFNVADILGDLQEHPTASIERVNTMTLG